MNDRQNNIAPLHARICRLVFAMSSLRYSSKHRISDMLALTEETNLVSSEGQPYGLNLFCLGETMMQTRWRFRTRTKCVNFYPYPLSTVDATEGIQLRCDESARQRLGINDRGAL